MNYSFEFELKQNMIRGENENPLCRINTWQYNGIEYYNFQTGNAGGPPPVIETKMERMINNLTKISILGITKDIFLANTYIDKGTLKEALE